MACIETSNTTHRKHVRPTVAQRPRKIHRTTHTRRLAGQRGGITVGLTTIITRCLRGVHMSTSATRPARGIRIWRVVGETVCRSIHALHPLRPRCPVGGLPSARAVSITPRVCWKGIGFSACRSTRPRFVRPGASILPILKMGWTRSIPRLELRMGTSAFVARDGRAESSLPARLRMIARRLAQKARRSRVGVVGRGGFRYSSLSGMGSLEHEKYQGSIGRRRVRQHGFW